MSDVSEWLLTLGLERYAPAFVQAEVDLATLRYLTDSDLREIGLPVGPRRRILSALETRGVEGALAATSPERRQLTVMFVDLADSTRLSSELDPEVLADLLKSYKEVVAQAVVSAEGFVAKYLGDGVLAYFGWPQAREDAPEASIRCAFQIVEQVKKLLAPGNRPLHCRIGIATGLVVVGGELGQGRAREDAIAGEAPNLAARLQGLAPLDGIVISDATKKQVGEVFECEALGARAINGFPEPVPAWRPLRLSSHVSRFQAARVKRSSFVGRQDELSLLRAQWQATRDGAGLAVLVLGEAGMGKSRLTSVLQKEIDGRPQTAMTWQCSAYHRSKPLYPVIECLRRVAGIGGGVAAQSQLLKLTDILTAAGMPVNEALPVLAHLLAIPPEAGYAPPALAPPQLRAATIVALRDWMRRTAARSPVLLIVEDAHWIDATTLELVTRLCVSPGDAPLMTVITARPEFETQWTGRDGVGRISLERLSERDCENIVRDVSAAAGLRDAVVAEIVARSDGNPLFVEELSAAVIDARIGAISAVPDSLQSSLLARLDRLGEAKHMAQVCSVLGRRFARPLLAAVAELEAAELDANLAVLVGHDLVRPVGEAREGLYEFKHALLRDAAYESLLLSDRRHLHDACARRLEERFPEVVRTEPELLAQHFSLAGLPARASRYFEQAGDRAAAAGAQVEVATSYQEALRQNDLASAGEERDRRTLNLLLKLGPVVTIIDGAQAPSVRDLYRRAEGLSRALDNQDALFKSVWGLWYNANIARDLDNAAGFAQTLVLISTASGDEDHRLEALHCRWSSALFRGDYATCDADAKLGANLYNRHRHSKLGLIFGGHDPGVCAMGCRAQTLSYDGDVQSAQVVLASALALAGELDHPPSVAHALLTGLTATTVVPAPELVHSYAQQMLELGRRFNVAPQQAVGAYHLAWLEARTADRSKGLEQMKALYDRVTAIGPITMLYRVMYIEQLLCAGRVEEALAVADAAVMGLRFPENGLLLCELYRLRGECLAAAGRKAEAVSELLRAETMAAKGGAALLRLRAAKSLDSAEGAERSRTILQQALDGLSNSAKEAVLPR